MTQLRPARKGVIVPEVIRVAMCENVTPEFIRDGVADRRSEVRMGVES
ncbi:MAG: hypothetical protein HZB38_18860 [Planctomycetes bacterium]|nr:hypothetical protein [Planctomycetota bacterium]